MLQVRGEDSPPQQTGNARSRGATTVSKVGGPSTPPSPPLPFLSPLPLPLEVGPLKPSYGVWGSAVSFPSGVWGRAPAEIDFGAFLPQKFDIWWPLFNDFPENQLIKFPAFYKVAGNRDHSFITVIKP